MIYYPFKVYDKIYCCWDIDILKTNLDFIESIDSDYFQFSAATFGKHLNGEDKQRAALAIRNIYHHSLETLFSIICATIQAPLCIYSWLNIATIGDIRNILRSLDSNKSIYNFFKLNSFNWSIFADRVFLIDSINKENENYIKYSRLFSDYWQSLSHQFLDDFNIKEYNSIKHGFRAKAGGYRLSVGPSKTLSDTKNSQWITLGNSEFGSSFHTINRIKGVDQKDPNIQATKYSLNWNPEALLSEIELISISLFNIISFLKIANGVDLSKITCKVPEEDDFFNEHWKNVSQTSHMNFSIELSTNNMDVFTKQELDKLLNY